MAELVAWKAFQLGVLKDKVGVEYLILFILKNVSKY